MYVGVREDIWGVIIMTVLPLTFVGVIAFIKVLPNLFLFPTLRQIRFLKTRLIPGGWVRATATFKIA